MQSVAGRQLLAEYSDSSIGKPAQCRIRTWFRTYFNSFTPYRFHRVVYKERHTATVGVTVVDAVYYTSVGQNQHIAIACRIGQRRTVLYRRPAFASIETSGEFPPAFPSVADAHEKTSIGEFRHFRFIAVVIDCRRDYFPTATAIDAAHQLRPQPKHTDTAIQEPRPRPCKPSCRSS